MSVKRHVLQHVDRCHVKRDVVDLVLVNLLLEATGMSQTNANDNDANSVS